MAKNHHVTGSRPPLAIELVFWCFFSLIIASPLVWIRPFSGTSIGLYHAAGFALVGSIFLTKNAFRYALLAGRENAAIFILFAGFLMAGIIWQTRVIPPFGFALIQRFAGYFVIAAAVTISTIIFIQFRLLSRLWILPLVTAVAFIVILSIYLKLAGVDPAAQFIKAVASRNPDLFIYPLTKKVFAEGGLEDVRANMRHSIALAFANVCLIGVMSRSMQHQTYKPLGKVLYYSGQALCIFIVLFSFSRSTWLAGTLAVMLLSLSLPKKGAYTILVAYGTVCAFAILALSSTFSGMVDLFKERLYQSTSYNVREAYSAERWQEILKHPILGSPDLTFVREAHNVVLDYWSSLGIIGLVLSVSICLAILIRMQRLCMDGIGAKRDMKAFFTSSAALLALPLVRLFTSPYGQFDVGVWIALAVSCGTFAVSRKVAARSPAMLTYARQLPNDQTALMVKRYLT